MRLPAFGDFAQTPHCVSLRWVALEEQPAEYPGGIPKTGSETAYRTPGDAGSSAGEPEVRAGLRYGTSRVTTGGGTCVPAELVQS